MKKIIFLFLTTAVLLSCQNKNGYTIKGTVADAAYEGKKVYIQQRENEKTVPVDTAVVTNGTFSFKGIADTTLLRTISLDESVEPKKVHQTLLLIEPGVIEVSFDSIITVRGTKVNEDFTEFRLKQGDLNKKLKEITEPLRGDISDSLKAAIFEEYSQLNLEKKEMAFAFAKNNIKNDLGKYLFSVQGKVFDIKEQKELIEMTDDAFKATPAVQKMLKRIENSQKTAIGEKFTDFTMPDPKGKEVSLSDYAGKGKYVLIDFWASWCGPCLGEIPHVVEAYKKYKNKGLEVVGVSFDNKHSAWVECIKDLKLTWPQMSDLKGWQSAAADLYVIEGIPHTILLDKEGTIIAKDLRGENLNKKLAELMP